MKEIVMTLVLSLVIMAGMFSCEMKYITSFAGSSSEYKIKDKCAIVRQETNKTLLQLDHNKDIVCLGKVEENGSVIMAYDDAGVIKKIIFKKCNKDKLRNKLYYMYFNRPDEEVDTSYYPPVVQGTILLQEFKERQKELDEYHRELLKRIREKEIEEDDSLEDEFFRVFKEFKKMLDTINIPTQNLDKTAIK